MAINKVPASSAFRLELQYGVDDAGNPVYRSRNMSNVKPAAAAQDVYDVASALTELQAHPLNAVYQVDVDRLEVV